MQNNLSETEKEMLESASVFRRFDFSVTKGIAQKIGNKRIIFTGMGSSLIFPAKQAKNRSLQYNLSNRIEVFFASDLFQYKDFSNTVLFLCSNSGKTKEVILLLEHAKRHGATCIAITTIVDSFLAKRCDEKIILSCGFEKGVAATKSIIEQALIYDSIIFHLAAIQGKDIDFFKLKNALVKTAMQMMQNMDLSISKSIIKQFAKTDHYFFVGLETGVAEEITLKSYEIARKLAIFYPDTHIVHGVEEAINGNIAVIFEPNSFKEYLSDFEKFSQKTGCQLFGIDQNSLIDGLNIQVNPMFRNYCLLAGGWALLRNVAHYQNIDIDHPIKASKVGNPYIVSK